MREIFYPPLHPLNLKKILSLHVIEHQLANILILLQSPLRRKRKSIYPKISALGKVQKKPVQIINASKTDPEANLFQKRLHHKRLSNPPPFIIA